MVVGLVDPVGNTVELHDLKPYTYYQLDLRDRNGQKLYASVNFSTAGQEKVYYKNIFYYVKGKRRYQVPRASNTNDSSAKRKSFLVLKLAVLLRSKWSF